MSEFESLLNVIFENPSVAFILADYLEEQADPRCELLRLVYTLKDIAEMTPERVAMENRLCELLFVENLEPVVPSYTNELGIEFVWIPPGTFRMGSPEDEPDRDTHEGPQHQVQLTRRFWLSRTPVTQRQWQEVMGNNPSFFQGEGNCPVEQVSWNDCQQFCENVSQRSSLEFRLPSEAQWEYACRAGTQRPRYAEELNTFAWYADNSETKNHAVGLKRANGWGLSDMLGNVWEWCHDGLGKDTGSSVTDPVGPTGADAYRCLRGGSWSSSARNVRAAYRDFWRPEDRLDDLGFRGSSSGSS